MAALTPSYQQTTEDRTGKFFVITRVRITGTASDTVDLPPGLQDATHCRVIAVDYSNTAPSVSSISQAAYPGATTVTLASGGTAGADMFLVSMHVGNAAGGV